jgi:hypothetical protein
MAHVIPPPEYRSAPPQLPTSTLPPYLTADGALTRDPGHIESRIAAWEAAPAGIRRLLRATSSSWPRGGVWKRCRWPLEQANGRVAASAK